MSAVNDSDYEYINEDEISRELICSICKGPLESPVSVQCCQNSFCKQCLIACLRRRRRCPLCQDHISSSSERPGYSELNVRIVRNQLNALHVRCTACHETNIERGQWENHDNICPEKDIPCTSADNRCSWHGPRHSLAEHLRVCLFEALRPSFDQLKNDSRLTTSKLEADVVELKKNVTFLLNIINHGDLMKKSCRNPKECVYHNRCNRKLKFPCINCPKDVAYNEVSLHTCSGGYICSSCVEAQYPSIESDSLTDTSGEDN